MNENKENVPKIRFPGFTDAWEQRRLGELAEFLKGNGYTKNDLTESGSPIVLYGRLYTKYETVINDVDTFVEMKDKSVISEGNEVVVPASGETAEDISRASVIGKPGIILGGDLNIIKPNQEIDPIFLALIISNGTQQKEMSKCAKGKSVVHLHNSDLKQINLLYPKLEEQQRIGKFFVEIDHLIILHQRKLNNVQNLKAGLLQKMFPKNGEDFPEVRFPGFTDAWEQRRLEEITLKIGSGKTPKGGGYSYVLEGIPLIRSQNIHDDLVDLSDVAYITPQTDEEMKNSRVVKNDVLLNITGASIGRSAVYRLSSDSNVNQHVCIIRPIEGYSSDFIQLNLASPKGQQQINNNQAGSGREGLNFQQIGQICFVFSSIEEQVKISSFFRNLDTLITLHQRKLEHLREQKKSLLQQMFV
ncbi:restriction endonuclease subunit S [Desulfotomaculum sp. 1211_IL3151]|uniref:restriction endonuclease subunit S n=1 Tax=Desulfotomaculum sp. 1211_IL3151 TaxID=3084055 RepID=UPI002FDAD83F